MAFKKHWIAELWSKGIKLYGRELKVCLRFTVRDPERENGRIVEVGLTPEDARSLAESLNEYADHLDEQIEKDARRITNLHLDSF
jgi:hypothetical protein